MDKTRTSTAPLIVAITILLVPVLYVVSYLVLAVPPGFQTWETYSNGTTRYVRRYYRYGGGYSAIAFWPLEQLDRKVWPERWLHPWEQSLLRARRR